MLRQRVVTALAIGVVALVTVFALPTWAMASILGLVLLLGAWEWAGFAQWAALARWLYVGVIALLMLLAAPMSQHPAAMNGVVGAALVWWLAALVWIFRFPTPVPSWLILIGGVFVILPGWLALTYLHGHEPLGRRLVFVVLATVWAADVGAYFVGRRLGRV